MNSSAIDALIFFGSILLLAGIITFPTLGFGGLLAVGATLYFGLALVNGAGRAENRHKNSQNGGKQKRGNRRG